MDKRGDILESIKSKFLNKYIQWTAFILFSVLGLNFLFQNCSPIRLTDVEAEARALEAKRIALGADVEVVTVGLNPVPDLKLFFIVDNSGTMKENHLNLAAAFGSMFDISSVSLSKFDTTTYLINTAQTAPSIISEKPVLDKISSQQSKFSLSSVISEVDFENEVRTTDFNLGYLPGDNVGYHLKKTMSPLSYQFLPAAVLGVQTDGGQIKFKNSIRKTASSDVVNFEQEFKDRLAIMSADRIPQVLIDSKYQPENYTVVDNESGLCAVSRLLKNPNDYIKVGDLLSFTIVSDENDNDPSGIKCIQSITEYDGTEDLVDGDCKFKETQIKYQTRTTTNKADDCKISGNSGYAFKFSYASASTDVSYKYVKTPAVYKALYYDLKYTSLVDSYQYYNTQVTYYIQNCHDTYTDGLKTGVKCVVDTTSKSGSKNGNFVAPDECYALAKSLDVNAINDGGYKPVCVGSYKNIGTCSTADSLCKIVKIDKINTVSNILGENKPATCLAKALTYADYNKDPVCTDSSKNVATCSSAELAAGCVLSSAAVYDTKFEVAPYDQTADGCLAWAKARPASAVLSLSDISKCSKNSNSIFKGNLSFTETKALDGGTSLPTGTTASCGVLSTLAYNKAPIAIRDVKNNDCVLTSINKATDVTEVRTAPTCSEQAATKCASNSNRNCAGALLTYAPIVTTNPAVYNDLKVKEPLNCDTLCSDSKLGVCGSGFSSSSTIEDYLKNKYSTDLICSTSTTISDIGKESLIAKLQSEEATLCPITFSGEPRFFERTKGPYRMASQVTEYVSGTKKDSNNHDIVVPLVEFIKSKVEQMSATNQVQFSAFVRKPGDPLGSGGSIGVAYQALIDQTSGQLESVLMPDYSVALKELSKIIKNSLERSFILTKMRPEQIIMKVFLIKKDSGVEVELVKTDWTQNGATLKISDSLEFIEGDQFRVEFQNFIPEKLSRK